MRPGETHVCCFKSDHIQTDQGIAEQIVGLGQGGGEAGQLGIFGQENQLAGHSQSAAQIAGVGDDHLSQIITAAADGAMASHYAEEYLAELE